jgi:hypothetical protein
MPKHVTCSWYQTYYPSSDIAIGDVTYSAKARQSSSLHKSCCGVECICYLVHLILGNVNTNEYLNIKMSIMLIQTGALTVVLGQTYKMFSAGLRFFQLEPENCNR